MKAPLMIAALLLLAPTVAAAQRPVNQPPKREPAVQKLGYYVGTWQGHGETLGGPFGKAGKLSSKMTCSWFAGRYQIVCRGEETGPTGKREFLNIKVFDQTKKAYTEYSVSSFGETEYNQGGSLVGEEMTWMVEQDAGGKPAKFRYVETRVSPVLMSYQAEVSVDGQPWTSLANGKIEKIK